MYKYVSKCATDTPGNIITLVVYSTVYVLSNFSIPLPCIVLQSSVKCEIGIHFNKKVHLSILQII